MRPRFLRSLLPALVLAALPAVACAGVFIGVSVNVAPPPLPVYVQPPCPQPGYIWAPGYWAWGPYGYYWVPGTWVLPPEVGLLWTPGWWGWDADRDNYLWHAGYWGPRVGFYGGIDYGYGYDGVGFDGGYWRRGIFFYNRAVVRVGPTFVTNVYYRQVYHPQVRHVSFNGGRGGIMARPTRMDRIAARERRYGFTSMQRRQENMARGERVLRANFNHGRPPIAATARPVVFHGRGVYGARAAGGPMRFAGHGPMRRRAPMPRMRSDRPPWASGQGRPGQRVFRGNPRGRPGYYHPPGAARPQFHAPRFQPRPQWHAPQRYQSPAPRWRGPQRFQGRPVQRGYQPRSNWAAPRPRAMPQRPQFFRRPQAGPGRGGPVHVPMRRPPPGRGRGPGRRW